VSAHVLECLHTTRGPRQLTMDEWTSKQLPERLPFSKKRLPKSVIFSCVGMLPKYHMSVG